MKDERVTMRGMSGDVWNVWFLVLERQKDTHLWERCCLALLIGKTKDKHLFGKDAV